MRVPGVLWQSGLIETRIFMTVELTMAVMPAMVVVVMATATSRRVFCHENHHNDGKNSHDGGEGKVMLQMLLQIFGQFG